MKKLLIMLFLFISLSLFSDSEIKILRTFYGYDYYNFEVKIQLIEYRIYKGFKITNKDTRAESFYFLTEKNKFYLTSNEPKRNYLWFTWKNIAGDMLFDQTPIFTLSIFDEKPNMITYVFNMTQSSSLIQNYAITFDRRFIK